MAELSFRHVTAYPDTKKTYLTCKVCVLSKGAEIAIMGDS